MKLTTKPRLKAGMKVRLTHDGPEYVVYRVTQCAAYIKGGKSTMVTIGERTFEAKGTEILPVSPNSAVWREEATPPVKPRSKARRPSQGHSRGKK